jgi:hypothetical protein
MADFDRSMQALLSRRAFLVGVVAVTRRAEHCFPFLTIDVAGTG